MNVYNTFGIYLMRAAIFVLSAAFTMSCVGRKSLSTNEFDFTMPISVENSNLYNIDQMFAEMHSPEPPDEYYFVVLGDSRNLVRSYDLSGFNYVAKHILYAKDRNEEHDVYDQIKFIMHLGDFVFEGEPIKQWENLNRAFSKKDRSVENYPYLKLLAKDKPIFPAVGNHDVMDFKFKKESTHKNLSSSNTALNNYYNSFNWDALMKHPGIMYSIPSELTPTQFTAICDELDSEDVAVMNEHYLQLADGNWYIEVYQDIIKRFSKGEGLEEAQMNFIAQATKSKIVDDLYRIYNKLDYNILPSLSPDNMACYAFEINGIIYLILDSTSHGWHYDVFSELKTSIYHDKQKQHYLNLFTKSDLNGQFMFFQAVKEYAQSRGSSISVFMHQSGFNSVDNIDGVGYQNHLKLMLGVNYDQEKYKNSLSFDFEPNTSNYTFFDDILFINSDQSSPDMQNLFTSCVHLYQHFQVNNYSDQQLSGSFNWHITGGGGGELDRNFDHQKLRKSETLYNQRLAVMEDINANQRSITISDNEIVSSYNYLLVHVKGNKIIDVIPKLIPEAAVTIDRPRYNVRAAIQNPTFYSPLSTGGLASIRFGDWGLEDIHPYLQFITWDPGVGYGFLRYDLGDLDEYAALMQTEILNFNVQFQQDKRLTLLLLGLTDIRAGVDQKRMYLTAGAELPILYNRFDAMKNLSLGFRYHHPLVWNVQNNPEFGRDINFSFYISFGPGALLSRIVRGPSPE